MRLSAHRIHQFRIKLRKDHISAYAGQSAYFIVLSFLPFLIFLLTLIQHLPIGLDDMLETLYYIIPENYEATVRSVLYDIHIDSGTTLLSISLIMTIWTAGKSTMAISNGLNSINELEENRNYVTLRLKAMIYTFFFALVVIFTMLVLVFGNRIYTLIHTIFTDFSEPAVLLTAMRTFGAFGIFFVIFTLFYTFLPVKKQKLIHQIPGAAFSAFSWMVSAYGFSLYVDASDMNSYMYGSLTYIILFLIYLYALMYLFFIGAELNVFFTSLPDEDEI